MRAAILSIGTELTRGELVNGNAAWLAEQLTALGCDVIEHATVPDDSERICATLASFGREVKLVVSTGGLGPTSDDLTAEAVAVALGVSLERHAPSLERIRERYRRIGREMPAPNVKQADIPAGAEVLANDVGTAPGFAIAVGDARCYFLPGVPSEMRHLFRQYLEPELRRTVVRRSHQIHIRSFGLRESEVAERLVELDRGGARQVPGVELGYRAHFPEIEVKVLCRANDEATARARAEQVAAEVKGLLAPHAYGGREDSYPAHVGRLLQRAELSLALAESCTGGLVGKLLTDVPGSSRYVRLSAVTYSNEAKRDLLGVGAELLERHGAVSVEVARAMAEGVLDRASADLAVAITGIAGPDGGSPDKPVGTVCFALARRGEKTVAERRLLGGDRERVRTLSAYVAMSLIARAVESELDARSGGQLHEVEAGRVAPHTTGERDGG